MGITAEEGPKISYGDTPSPPNSSNPQIGPDSARHGYAMLDPRAPYTYQPGQSGGVPSDRAIFTWPVTGGIPIVDQVPSAASTTNIVNAATPASGTPLTLVSASGSGITVACAVINANTNLSVSGLLGIDVCAARTFTGTFTNGSAKITFTGVVPLGAQVNDPVTLTTSNTLPAPFATATTYYIAQIAYADATATSTSGALMLSATPGGAPIAATSAGAGTQTVRLTAPSASTSATPATPFQPSIIFGKGGNGAGGPMRYWNPNWALSRTLVITTNADDTGGFYTVAGYDIYGYPMTQKVTGVNNSTANTTKAFKYIASITPSGTINSTSVSVGTNDNFGLPLRTDNPLYLFAWYNATAMLFGTTVSTTFTIPDINAASSTTGDVRGLFYGGAASDGTKRYTIIWNPQANNQNSMVGLLGQAQA